MTANLIIDGLSVYILVFSRMGGMLFFNPLLARKNVPSQVRAALALGLTILITPTVPAPAEELTDLVFIWMLCKELLVGAAFGFVFQIFYYLLFAAGDIIDLGFGMSMAKAFDPGTNIQISLSGNLFQILFVLYLFATNSHLVMIRLMASSYDIVGMGAVTFGADVGSFMFSLFSSAFQLIVQLCLPFLAASFVLEISMGILMKLIPQINVFSIHFQFKILVGLLLLFLFAQPTAAFMEKYISTMLASMKNLLGIV